MAQPALQQGQYSIGPPGGPSYVYGWGTVAQVSNTSVDTGSMNVQDQAVVGQDGIAFGVDTMPGMIVTQTGQCYAPGAGVSAMDTYDALAGAWNAPAQRLVPGAMQELRAWYPYSVVTRRCYGRGRKIMPVMGQVFTGQVPFTAQFQAADGIWYSDTEYSVTLTTVPSYLAGMIPPVTPPLILAAQSNTRSNSIANTGPQPTWPVITFTGPVVFPSLSYQNTPVQIIYGQVLPAGRQVTIDTRPWARTATLDGGSSVAGALLGSPMTAMQLPPGSTLGVLGGQDLTGTASCTVRWRNAHLSIGGST